MRFRGQSAIEWLMTHSWSIIVVLSVSAVLFYSGVFEATARPRFEGLASSGLHPVPEQVKLYSDGVLVFTVLNTRPYPIRLEWVEVAPIADKDDVVRTDIGELIQSGDIGVFNVNASNILVTVGASVFFVPAVDAASQFVDFFICWNETYIAGGTSQSRVICGKALNIVSVSEPYGGVLACSAPGGPQVCVVQEDCGIYCMDCAGGYCHDSCSNDVANCGLTWDDPCDSCKCVATAESPLGTCVPCKLC